MFNVQQFAMSLIEQRMQKDPNFGKDENTKRAIELIRSGNEQEGVQLAKNYLNTFGVSQNQALQQAAQFFGLK